MKIHRYIRNAMLLASVAAYPAIAHAFDFSNDGSYGMMNITTNTTLALPSDGIFRCTSIMVATNATLTFTPNALNTPVYLLAQSNIVIRGTIDVSGQDGESNGVASIGGMGGFAGGQCGQPTTRPTIPPGAGQGPGGGLVFNIVDGAGGSFGTFGNPISLSAIYGNQLLVPLVGGSGGGGSSYASGGAGGGAVLLAASNSVTIYGDIKAEGGTGTGANGMYSGGGSGGAVRIVAPVVLIPGSINVSGGTNVIQYFYYYGGNGRVRIDALNPVGTVKVVGFGRAPAPVFSVGRSLFLFPPNHPQLYFVNAAGTPIPANTNGAVSFSLLSSSSTNQLVSLSGSGFAGQVPVEIVASPDQGTPFITNIVMNFPNAQTLVTTNVMVTLIPNQYNHLAAYARYGVKP